MRLIAHRGLSHSAPENTLAAFACALAVGFHGIETDVRLSSEGELVLFHDRTTPSGDPVSAVSRNALSQQMGYLVPTLPEALEAFPEALWNLEIKTPSVVPALYKLIRECAHPQNLLLSSCRHEVIIDVSAHLDIACGLLLAHRPPALNTVLYPAMPYARLRTLIWEYESIDAELLQQAHALGFHNWVYGAETDAEHAFCADLDVHSIITDYPEFVGLSCGHGLQ